MFVYLDVSTKKCIEIHLDSQFSFLVTDAVLLIRPVIMTFNNSTLKVLSQIFIKAVSRKATSSIVSGLITRDLSPSIYTSVMI